MKLAILLTALALTVNAQQPPAGVAAKAAGTVGNAQAGTTLQNILALEKQMDDRLGTTGSPDPCVVRGPSRGLYVSGLGAVFSAEVELSATPGGVGMFAGQNSPEMKAKYHKIKVARVPQLEQTVRDIATALSASPALKLADSDQVVVVVRLWYQRWEDTTGLPGQIVARLDRRGGTIKMDVQ